jgi:hypothetical protein
MPAGINRHWVWRWFGKTSHGQNDDLCDAKERIFHEFTVSRQKFEPRQSKRQAHESRSLGGMLII